MKELNERMIEFRAKNNLSQIKFAKMCKLSIQTVCNVENGTQKPTNLTKYKILSVIEKEN